ncbi:hypothetical protein [Micromonospora coerulea]|uniref:hypothetical protein n=1 Tax=Micromonospora coerulea TaxID=47856 RepID=UPI001F285F30|nr:hypothetical protein [Micromonospora veneta]
MNDACVEVSPAGVAVVPPNEEGWLLHTNHFLDPVLAAGELRGRREPETYDRFRALSARVREWRDPDSVGDLAALLTVHADDGAEVCCHPPIDGRLGPGGRRSPRSRWSRRPDGSCCRTAARAPHDRGRGFRSPHRRTDAGSQDAGLPRCSADSRSRA